MVGFGKHALKKVFPVALFTALVLLPPMVMAATVGFYAGTFDPPTQVEIGMASLCFRRCQRSARMRRNRQNNFALCGVGERKQ